MAAPKKILTLVASLFFILSLVLAVRAYQNRPIDNRSDACGLNANRTAFVNQTRLKITFVSTPAQSARGLAGCEVIPPDSGMYFPLSPERTNAFWMKGMLTDIDIIWLRDGRVIGITPSVPAPEDPTSANLPLYYPPGPVDGVLELAAFRAQELAIDIGTSIQIQ